jgi:DsbC/DsbD-like thiol-disulfide interchange protein
MLRRLLILLGLLLVPALAHSRGIEPELVAEGPAPAGGEVELAIHMQPAPGWHGYWLNPGDAGLPMDVQWHLPKGFAVGPLRYPVPTRLEVANLMNYVYEQDYAVLVRLKVPANASGTIPIRAEAHWLACTDKICVPEQGELSLDLPVGKGTPERAQFDAWRQKLPQPLASIGHFEASGNKLRVAIPLPASVKVDKPYLFPMVDGPIDYDAKQDFRRSGDLLIAELAQKGPLPAKFAAVIALGDGRGLELEAIPGPVPQGTPIGGLGWSAVLWAVLGAIAGGILLNLMPCVFPILALKALHISRAGGEAAHARCRFGGGLGVPAAGPAYDHAPAAARGSDHREPARRVRASGAWRRCTAGGQLRHRSAGRVRRDALRRSILGRSARHRTIAAGGLVSARFCRPRARPRSPVRARVVRPGDPKEASEARRVDAHAPAHSRDSNGSERRCGGLAALSAGGRSSALVWPFRRSGSPHLHLLRR